MAKKIDHDRLFKELLMTFFVEFIALFFPTLIEYLERDSIEFLDKEIFTDITEGEKHEADLIARCRFRGEETFFLIHTEPQSTRRVNFARRMFIYFSRLVEKYGLPVYSIALFSYDKPKTEEKNQFVMEFPDHKALEFNFKTIQLNRLNWRDFLKQENPIASALMAKMGFKKEERVLVKAECLRMIVRLKLDPARTQLLSGFVDTYLRLREEEKRQFNKELEKLPTKERKGVMEITTSWKEEGIQIGLQQASTSIVLRLLKKRFTKLTKKSETQIQKLSTDKLQDLSEALLDFRDKKDLEMWLNNVSNKN
jgi:hypothetical protein